jgi:SAM-dependent methyltransferase
MQVTRTMAAASPVVPESIPRSARWTVFVHQDGLVLCTTLRALRTVGILDRSLACEASLADVWPDVRAEGFGYLRVGLRCLVSQGWLADEPGLEPESTVLRWTDAGRSARRWWDRYSEVGEFLAGFSSGAADVWSRPWTAQQTERFLSLLPLACDRWRLDRDTDGRLRALTTTHLDAGLVVPAMLSLRGTDRLGEDGPDLPDSDLGHGIATLFTALGWLDEGNETWTASGRRAAAYSVHFGMAASYLPLFARLPQLYRGERVVASESQPDSVEWHVHRELNVNASAAAHKRYFSHANGIVAEVFDREPVSAQPRFVADMGCGDGSWLVHLYRLITERTLRGKRLASDPLLMVGLDYNAAALEEARRVLRAANVPALLVHGDIGDPDAVQNTLAEHGLTMADGLHVRAFIDHDRAFQGGDPALDVCGWSTGAYVDDLGRPLAAEEVERDLVAHLRRWAPHVHRHGLVMLEAHSIPPRIARGHLGATHSVAFDAYHGYSHQYPIEHSAFLRCCRLAGLQPATCHERRYPSSRPFIAVSLNRLRVPDPQPLPAHASEGNREDTWTPPPGTDLEDGRALHGLLYEEGDVRYPRSWCSAPTGCTVAGALDVVDARLATARRGDVIRILDYGAGTGLATIEFLKACRERGIEERLGEAGATLEVHLVDIPSSWYAQGFALLESCAWTRFHSLQAPNGGFRALREVLGGRLVDAVIANMVFHLIPPHALARVAGDLADIMAPGGRLMWNSPDLGPAGAHAILFHDPNRALRARWSRLLGGEPSNGHGPPALAPPLQAAIREAGRSLDAAALAAAQQRADRRVLRRANLAADVSAALADHFTGDVELPTYEILDQDIVDTLLVPSNQAEFLSEVSDRAVREAIVRELMLNHVIPSLQQGAAGTATGLNVQWTAGRFTKIA